jgi:lipopolysaccharide transport system permease protein
LTPADAPTRFRRSIGVANMRSLIGGLDLLRTHRSLLLRTAWNDVRARHAGTAMGLAWLALYPLLLLGVYAAVYLYVFKVRFGLFNSNEYVLLIFCGLIPFLGFAEALGSGTASVTGNASLIRNTLFPIELVPVKTVLVSQSVQVVGSAILILALAVAGKLSLWALFFPVIWALQIAFTMGIIWLLSGLNVFFRDLQYAMGLVTLALMMASPIAYTPEMVPGGLRKLLALNPMYYLITCYQDCLMLARFPHPRVFAALVAIALGSFVMGHWFFARVKRVLVDNV